MPSIARLFGCLRSRTSIPLEEKKIKSLAIDLLKGEVILRCPKCFVRYVVLFVNLISSSTQLQLHRHRPKSGVASQAIVQDPQLTLNLRGVNQVNDADFQMPHSHCCIVSNELNYRPRKRLLPAQVSNSCRCNFVIIISLLYELAKLINGSHMTIVPDANTVLQFNPLIS